MHEMSIAVEIVHSVMDAVQEHHPIRITEVEVQVGMMQQIVPDALTLAFASASEGTLVEGAKLVVKEEKIVAVCRQCDCLYLPESDVYTCPQCQAADARIVGGNDLLLRSIVCETEDEEVAVP